MEQREDEYISEHKGWLETLDMLQLEIVLLKDHVSELAQHQLKTTILEKIEFFQNSFLDKDIVIALLLQDIRQLRDTLSVAYAILAPVLIKRLSKKQEQLRIDIGKLEKEVKNCVPGLINVFIKYSCIVN